MPVYEYECAEHGRFESLRALAEYAEPASCPTCESAAPRVLSTPHLSSLARGTMLAHERNEKSRHEPRHAAHAHPPAPKSAAPALKSYRGARPWVIEHG